MSIRSDGGYADRTGRVSDFRLTVLRDARRDRRERSTMQDPGSSIPTREFGIIFATAFRKEKTMRKAGTLHDAFVDELRDTYDAEKQLTKALAKMAKTASSPDLKEAFEAHLEETRGQIERLDEVFASLDEKVRGKHCDGIAGIIDEGKSIMEEDFDATTMDACLIAAGQRAEHYEMAAYGTLIAWADAMGHTEAANLLQQTLDEEKAADKKLSALAEGGVNQEAAHAAHAGDEDDDAELVGAGRRTNKTNNRTTKFGTR